jgi:hypothetical protein
MTIPCVYFPLNVIIIVTLFGLSFYVTLQLAFDISNATVEDAV